MGSQKLSRFIALLLSWALATVAGAQSPPVVKSESYILMDAETGTVLAEKNADLPLPPASLTKIMTAYTAFRAIKSGALSMEQTVLVSERAWAQNVVGSKTFLQVGTQVSVRDLLYGIMVQSGNDASIALAEGLYGDETAFVSAMNEQAAELSLSNTKFTNVTGLPDAEHYSSARDIAILVRHSVLEYPDWYQIYAEREFTYNDIRQPNRNGLLESFSGTDGVKTGYTKNAGYCLAASAVRDGRRLIVVVMNTASSKVRERESTKLLSFGFGRFVNAQLFDATKTKKMRVYQGVKDFVAMRPQTSGVMTLPRGKKTEAIFVPAGGWVTAPVVKNSILGTIQIRIGEKVEREIKVEAVESVASAPFWKRWLDMLKVQFTGHYNDENLFSEW